MKPNPNTSCIGKDPLTHEQANAAARRMRLRTRATAYRCPVCDHWHVGVPNGARIQSTKGRGR